MRCSFPIVLLLTFVVPAIAQETGYPDPSNEQQGSAPAPLIGQSVRRGPLLEEASPNYVAGGISVSQMWTDNVDLAPTGQVSDFSWDIAPNITLNHFTPRLSYDLGVLAGFVVNRDLTDRNRASQTAAFDLSYGLAQFVTLRLSDSFTNIMGLWSGAGAATGSTGAGIGSVQQPNRSLFTYGDLRSNTALAELTTQFGPSSFAGVRGTYSYLSYPSAANDPVLGTLYGGNTYSAEAFYNHQFTARNWGGITVRAERFDIDNAVGRTDTVSMLLFYALSFRPKMSLSFFGGPELSVTAPPEGTPIPVAPFSRRMWSPTGGVIFAGQGRTMSGAASYTHGISDGGGLASAVTLDSADAQILRQFWRHLQLGPGFTYALNTPIVPGPTIRTYSGRFQVTYRLRNCSFGAGYARDDRSDVNATSSASANRVWVSFFYGFLKPLGQ